MTRQECEAKLLDLAEQMYSIYKEYNPSGDFLSMSASRTGCILVSDSYFNSEGNIILDANNFSFSTVDCAQYSDGSRRLTRR